MAEALENLAPAFALEVGGKELGTGLTQFVRRLEYESADGLADAVKISIVNPDFSLSDLKALEAGNEIGIWMGYGTRLRHIGRVVITKKRDRYPQNGMPEIEVEAFTRDVKMMDNEPEGSKKQGSAKNKGGRAFPQVAYSDIAALKATEYQMSGDIDPTPGVHSFAQRPGVSDYALLRGLANITGFLFWVDGDEHGRWTLHFRDPEKALGQDETYTFRYNDGDFTTLFSFEPEYLITGPKTKITVTTRHTETGRLLSEEIEEDSSAQPDPEFDGDVTATLEEPHQSGGSIKLFIGDYAFEVVASKRFKTQAELKEWARQWFRRQRESFVTGKGQTIGVETLLARQVHKLVNLSSSLDGDYYFSRVRHVMDSQSGYLCDFNARKVL